MNNGQESELIIIEGNVSRITFRNDENGYSVFTLIKDNNKEERCVGSFIELHEGDRLELRVDILSMPSMVSSSALKHTKQ